MTQVRITNQDLVMSYLFTGVEKVSAQLVSRNNPAKAIDGMLEILNAQDPSRDVSDLLALRSRFATSTGTRGRGPLVDGETRTYKAQEVNGSVFIRLPVDMVGAAKGDEVTVSLNGGVFTVRV